jgi:hypothetical protein
MSKNGKSPFDSHQLESVYAISAVLTKTLTPPLFPGSMIT